MKKALYFDVETTGLNSFRHAIIQFACLVEIDGKVVEEWETKVRPFPTDEIDQRALEVNGITQRDLERFPHPKEVHTKMCSIFGKYVSKFEKGDKFCPIGYNVQFDIDFLQSFFKKNDDKYYGSWMNYKIVDPLRRLHELDYEGKIDLPDYKLSTVCEHFAIPHNAHEALSDIKATRELRKLLSEMKFNVSKIEK